MVERPGNVEGGRAGSEARDTGGFAKGERIHRSLGVGSHAGLSPPPPSRATLGQTRAGNTRELHTRRARVGRSSWQGPAMPGLLRTTLVCLLVGVVAVELLRNAHDADRDVDRGTIDTSIEIKAIFQNSGTKIVPHRITQRAGRANDRSRARGIVGCAPGRPSAEFSAEKYLVWRI